LLVTVIGDIMKKIHLAIVLFLCSIIVSACQSHPAGLEATSTYVVANVLVTRTAQALAETGSATPGPQVKIRTAATTAPLSTPESASPLLFFDDFSDPNSGWDEESDEDGGRSYSDGGFRIYVAKTEWCYWTTIYRTFSDVIIEVDGQKVGGSDNNEYGVVCRLNEDNNFYYFGISGEGFYGIGKLINDEWLDLGDEGWGFNDRVIEPGTKTNHLKAECSFDNLSLEVNGSTLIDVTDPELRSGDVGLYVCAYDDAGADILFDNFKVTRP